MLSEVSKENKRLSQCLLESNRILLKIEQERIAHFEGFQRAKDLIVKVILIFATTKFNLG